MCLEDRVVISSLQHVRKRRNTVQEIAWEKYNISLDRVLALYKSHLHDPIFTCLLIYDFLYIQQQEDQGLVERGVMQTNNQWNEHSSAVGRKYFLV